MDEKLKEGILELLKDKLDIRVDVISGFYQNDTNYIKVGLYLEEELISECTESLP